jgi:hypothetical protein
MDNVAWPEEEKPEPFDLSKAIEPDSGIEAPHSKS